MSEIRHNFTKDNSLSAQLMDIIRYNISDIIYRPLMVKPETIEICRKKWTSKAWHSSTYEGQSHNYIFRLSGDKPIAYNNENISYTAIDHILKDHEFSMRKSFVAAIALKNIDPGPSYIDIEIEAIIIIEE